MENNEIEKKDHKKLFRFIKILIFIIISITLSLLYSHFISTKGIGVKEYKVSNESLPESFNGIKIAHISDIHYGRTTFKKELNYLVQEINKTKPDVVVFTGDLIDKDTKLNETMINDLIDALSKIEYKLGKYYITGNDDYDFADYNKIMTSSNFENLNDTYKLIYNESNTPILISGISTNLKSEISIQEKINKINSEIGENIYNYEIMLLHEPDYLDDIDYSTYALILSGHSHGGQIRLPFIGSIITPAKAKKYYNEYYKINNTDLYISSGIGTSTISFRLFNKPSFNLYRLTK